MRLYSVNGTAEMFGRWQAGSNARQLLGRWCLGAALVCFVTGLCGASGASNAERVAGAQLFKDKGCEHCHGVDGVGTEKGPALTTVGKHMHRNEIERQIRDGGKEMPPFGDELSSDEMHELVVYLAHKKKDSKPVPAS